jgi:hypothetical protein
LTNYKFDGSISREVLNNYLARAVTHTGLGMDCLSPTQTFGDDLRMLLSEGAKFVGRAAFAWEETNEAEHQAVARERAELAHRADPDFILQACVFECIQKAFIDSVPIPGWVFEAYDLPVERRNFSYDRMLNPNGMYVNHWHKDCSVQDITQLESRLWIYYRACSYIASGYEGIHFGQVHLIGGADEGFKYWNETIGRVRGFAAKHARRHYVLCDAHTHGISVDGRSLFDYNAWPLRLKETVGKPMEVRLEEGYHDSIFGRSKGGVSPSGWSAQSMPFIVELDNFGRSRFKGEPRHESHFAWGYDEITWFALQSDKDRHAFLRYIWRWVRERYPEGWVQMPSRRCLTENLAFVWDHPDRAWLDRVARDEFLSWALDHEGKAHILRSYYSANARTDACPFGYGDEDVIKECFANPRREANI